MEIFTTDDKFTKLIRSNYNLLPVINRFGIKLGVKDKSVEEVCDEHNVPVHFFLAIINTFHNDDYFPDADLASYSPLIIVDYLKKTHSYYIDHILPKIEHLLKELLSSCTADCKDLKMIDTFYHKYKQELLTHIEDEEKNTFPYIEELLTQPKKLKSNYTIKKFEKEHSNVDIKLNDLKNLIIKYLKPNYDALICSDFLIALYRFEKDIKDHARIEDNILVPQVLEIEKQISK